MKGKAMEVHSLLAVFLFLGINELYLVSSIEDEFVQRNSSAALETTDEPTIKYKQFLHVSDLHMDRRYDEGRSCKKDYNETNEDKPFGNFKCDAPKLLVKSAIEFMRNKFPNPDFILWTGDNSPHYEDGPEWDEVFDNMKFVVNQFHNNFPDTQIIPALGNHDSSPPDNFADVHLKGAEKEFYSEFITKGALGDFLNHSYDNVRQSFVENCGFYVLKSHNLYHDEFNITQTFIVLNTNLYYNNKAKTNPDDPCDQLALLESHLTNVMENENVFIVGHVPPGFFDLYPSTAFYNNENITRKMMDIVTRDENAKKIVAHFYGHTHTSSFRLLSHSSNTDSPNGIAFIAPSITPRMPFNGVNPSIRVYDYDVTNRKIVNFYQHYLPLDDMYLEDENKDISQIEKDASDDEILLKDDRRNRNSKFMKHPPDINRKRRDIEKDKKPIKVGKKGKGTPKYLRNPKFLQCLDSTSNILCLPSVKPKDCSQSMFKKMKSLKTPPPDCNANQNSGPENIESTSETIDPNTSLGLQTDESFPLNPDQKVKNPSEITSRNDDDEADMSDEDNNGDQLNASIKNDGLVEKWKLAFDASKDFNVTEFTPEQMLNVWSNMKIYGGRTFGAFEKQLVVLRNGFNCSKDQHAYIICSIRYVLEDELKDCLSEMDSKMPPPWNQANTDPSTQKTNPINFTTAPTGDSLASATKLQDSYSTTDDITNSRQSSGRDIFSTKPPKITTIKSESTEHKNKGATSSKEQVVTEEEGASSGVTAVVVLTLLVLLITGATILYKRRDRWRNRQSDEFLLTDSVFKYDGYSQVDQP